MYGVPPAQCEPIRSRNLSPLPRNRFLEPEAVIAEGIKGGGKTLPANVFSVPSRTIGGRIRKVSQYSVRSDEDDDDDDRMSYLSAAEEEPEEPETSSDSEDVELRKIERLASNRRRRVTNISRSRSENDVRKADLVGSRRFAPSPFLTVPDHGQAPIVKRRTRSVRSLAKGARGRDDKIGRKRRSPKTRRRSLPVTNAQRPALIHRTTSPLSQRFSPTFDPISAGRGGGLVGMAGTALAGAGMLAMGVGGGEILKGVVVEDKAEENDMEDVLPQSPSPPIIEINLQEEDGNMRRINSVADQFSDASMEKSDSPSPPPPPRPPPFSPHEVEEMRRVLKFFFMDPIQKWKAKRRFPWKLCLQLLKIVFITVQLCLFASQRSAFITFTESNKVAFEHLFLHEWDPALEGMPYPPPRGPYAVYDKATFFDIVDYAVTNYFNMSDLAVGTYAVRPPADSSYGLHPTDDDSPIPSPTFCQTFYPNASINPESNNYSFPSRVREECIELGSFGDGVSIRDELALSNKTIDFDSLINVTLQFKVKTIHFRSLVALDFVTCYIFDVNILLDNHGHNGQILVSLRIKDHWQSGCTGVTAQAYHEDEIIKGLLIFFDAICICVSVLSMILCLRSLKRAYRLYDKTDNFLMAFKGSPLSKSERWEFVNFWYLTIILNDVLAVVGSVSKILMETKTVIDWNLTGLALGTSNLLVWVGVLRYLSFFSRYNILIVTLKHAMPDLIRFLVCTLVLFFGFVFCGWAVLGPYNLKFRSIWTTMMCLFSLVNGDDMFVTFTASSPESTVVWYYSQIYLYAFICLFIYVNISLFTAVILDSYSLIKYYYQHGFPKSDLFEFIDECSDPPEGESYKQRSLSTLPMNRRPKSRISQLSVPHSVAATSSATASSTTAPTTQSASWTDFRTAVSKSTANCFRCCKRGRRRKHATNISGHTNHSRINRSDSHRQQLVYSSDSDDNAAHPGSTVHM